MSVADSLFEAATRDLIEGTVSIVRGLLSHPPDRALEYAEFCGGVMMLLQTPEAEHVRGLVRHAALLDSPADAPRRLKFENKWRRELADIAERQDQHRLAAYMRAATHE